MFCYNKFTFNLAFKIMLKRSCSTFFSKYVHDIIIGSEGGDFPRIIAIVLLFIDFCFVNVCLFIYHSEHARKTTKPSLLNWYYIHICDLLSFFHLYVSMIRKLTDQFSKKLRMCCFFQYKIANILFTYFSHKS